MQPFLIDALKSAISILPVISAVATPLLLVVWTARRLEARDEIRRRLFDGDDDMRGI